ncbi:MAG TPA: protein-L-isoaspartate(D-aspartate) O-methyltransferase [Longimicrobiales bacterium]
MRESEARRRMVQEQLAARGVRDQRVLVAMAAVPRHLFVPLRDRAAAYEDRPLGLARAQTISQPFMVATMTEALALHPDERVLEIGTGSGYQTAVLAELAREVYTVERDAELALDGRELLEELGYGNVRYLVGDGTLGWPSQSPFDAILVTAGAPAIPRDLQAQLREGGRMVIPIGGRDEQELYRVTHRGNDYPMEWLTTCRFVPLVGEEGWSEG